MNTYGWVWTLVTSDKQKRVNLGCDNKDPFYAFTYNLDLAVNVKRFIPSAIEAPLPLYFQPEGDKSPFSV